MSRGRYAPIDSKVIKERFDLRRSKLKGVAFAVEKNELPGPVSISLLGIPTEMPTAAYDRKLIEQSRPGSGIVTP